MKTQTVPDFDTLRSLLRSWRRSLTAQNKAPATVKSYLTVATAFVDYLDAQGMPRRAGDLTREHVESYIALKVQSGSAANAAKHYRSLQQLFNWLKEDGEIRTSPMENMKPPKVPEQPVDILSIQDVEKLLKATRGKSTEEQRDNAAIRLLWDGGVRASELVMMCVEDVDLDLNQVTIMGKGRKRRTIALSNNTMGALDKYIRQARRRHPWARRTDRVWLGTKGPWTYDGLRQMLDRRAAEAGVANVHPHRFRHTSSHDFLAAGGQETDLQRKMGWESGQMVGRYARSAGAERSREATRRLALGDRL